MGDSECTEESKGGEMEKKEDSEATQKAINFGQSKYRYKNAPPLHGRKKWW
jgi:hypothetical protein